MFVDGSMLLLFQEENVDCMYTGMCHVLCFASAIFMRRGHLVAYFTQSRYNMLASVAISSSKRRQKRRRGGELGLLIETKHVFNAMKKEPDKRSAFELSYISNYVEKSFPKFFKSISPSEDVREHHIMDFVSHCQYVCIQKDEAIFYQGEVSHRFFFIIKGSVTLYVFTERDPLQNLAEKQNKQVLDNLGKKSPPKHHKKKVEIKKQFMKDTKGDTSHLSFQIEPLPEYFKSIDRLHADRQSVGERKVTLSAGTSFGQLGLLTRRRRSATIISEGCELLILDKKDYDRIIKPSHVGRTSRKFLHGIFVLYAVPLLTTSTFIFLLCAKMITC